MPRRRSLLREPLTWGIVLTALFLLAQLVPVERTNPPVTGRVEAPGEVQDLLRRACMDCHSNETHWPWYGYVAPISWLLTRDVAEAREHLNFTTWDLYDAEERADLMEEIDEEVSSGAMPLKIYLPLHGEARLTQAEREMLVAWARRGGGW